ncbi:MAG: DUF3592 domain-containing protein [Anaerolineae bacterium]|nr:MAG: DUF3592 domain-containing protein [Anaerolineae bacterium]
MDNPEIVGISLSVLCTIAFFVIFGIGMLAVLLPMFGVFGGIGWFLNKRSKEAKAARDAAQSWPSTSGTVVLSRVEVTGGDHASVSPNVQYTYQVDGQPFQAAVVRAGDQFMAIRKSGEAYKITDRYPVGAQVTVYYNPANPSDACLER